MKFIDVKSAAKQWNLSERRITALCRSGRIEGAKKEAGLWFIPNTTKKPVDGRTCKTSRVGSELGEISLPLEKVARGIYITDDVWPDELYIMQVRNSAVIFSGETALYLHGLIDREYSDICITVPTGYNATHLKADNVQVQYAPKETYAIGVCDVVSSSGNKIRVYDKERCICDLIMDRGKIEVQQFQTAMKDYMLGKDKKLSRLIEYAERLGIRDEVMKYVEVLV